MCLWLLTHSSYLTSRGHLLRSQGNRVCAPWLQMCRWKVQKVHLFFSTLQLFVPSCLWYLASGPSKLPWGMREWPSQMNRCVLSSHSMPYPQHRLSDIMQISHDRVIPFLWIWSCWDGLRNQHIALRCLAVGGGFLTDFGATLWLDQTGAACFSMAPGSWIKACQPSTSSNWTQ